MVKIPPASAAVMDLIPGLGRSLEKEMATHSSVLAWEVPSSEEPGGLYSKESDMTEHECPLEWLLVL